MKSNFRLMAVRTLRVIVFSFTAARGMGSGVFFCTDDSFENYRMASTGFHFDHSGPSYHFDCRSLSSCNKHYCEGHNCIKTETECYPKQQCTQDCNRGECDMECNGKNCHQYCNTSGSKCNLECHGSNQPCTQECNHGECVMECKGQNCQQICNTGSSKCSLECHGSNQPCTQECNRGECVMECNGKNCHQYCNNGSSKCSLECHGSNQPCTQECNHGECEMECKGQNCHQNCNTGSSKCSLECHDSNQQCKQQCNVNQNCQMKCLIAYDSNQCQQSCFADDNIHNYCTSTATTMEKATLERPLRTASVHYHPCRYYCTETSLEQSSSSTPSLSVITTTTAVATASSLSQSSSSSISSSLSSSASLSSSGSSFKTATSSLPPSATLSAQSSPPMAPDRRVGSKNITRTKDLVTDFLSELNKTNVRQQSSLKDAVSLLENTMEQFKNASLHREQLSLTTEQERKVEIFKMAFAFEEFARSYGQYHLNASIPQFIIANNKLVMHMQRVFSQNASDFHFEGTEEQNSINIPSSNLHNNGSVLVGIAYKYLHEILEPNSSSSVPIRNKRRLDAIIIAATMDPKLEKLKQNIVLKFRNLKVTEGKRSCMFWRKSYSDKNPDGWSDEGCHVVRSRSTSRQTECSCNHLTHFAVLFDYGGNIEITKTDETTLRILTYVGLTLSIAGIILTIFFYAYFTDVHQPLSQIRISLASSLGAGQVIFLAGINSTGNTGACVTVAAVMQYFFMAAFCWMLVEGIYLYLFVVKVYNINNRMKMYYVMSWGFPAVMVAISLSIAAGRDGVQSFVSEKYCWMSSDNNLIWIFVAFVVMIEVVNILILVRVIKEMTTMQSARENQAQQIRLGIKACAVLIPLLGVTWLLGLLSPLHKAFVYIFTILNSVQGFLMFLLHCLRNSQIKERFRRRMNAVFPHSSTNDVNSTKKTSHLNQSDADMPKAMELHSVCDLKS